jgi:hypothetical protein
VSEPVEDTDFKEPVEDTDFLGRLSKTPDSMTPVEDTRFLGASQTPTLLNQPLTSRRASINFKDIGFYGSTSLLKVSSTSFDRLRN